jgi:hypothetical protein
MASETRGSAADWAARFDLDYTDEHGTSMRMFERPDGDYVRYDDYEKLRTENAALKADAERLDWMASRSSFLCHHWQGGGWTLTIPQPPVDGVRPPPVGFGGDTVRATIDAARAAGASDE